MSQIAYTVLYSSSLMSPNSSNPNRQRDHQANERTYLAWLRTSLALIGFGFAIARFGLFTRQISDALSNQAPASRSILSSETLGVGLVVCGILAIILATWRFNEVFEQIERQSFRPRRWLMWFMTGLILTIGGLSIPLVLWHAEPTPTRQANPPQKKP